MGRCWGPLLSAPLDDTLTRSVVPSFRSRTNTSKPQMPKPHSPWLVSPWTRLVADDEKATKRPRAEIATPRISAPAPCLARRWPDG